MDSRLSAPYNERAASIRMIPGGYAGIPMNMYEGGEPVVEMIPKGAVQKVSSGTACTPSLADIARLREAAIKKYEKDPYAKGTTYTDVLKSSKLNIQYTKAKRSDLPDDNFDIIGSEYYFEAPVLWQTSIGEPSRLFGRTGGVKYKR